MSLKSKIRVFYVTVPFTSACGRGVVRWSLIVAQRGGILSCTARLAVPSTATDSLSAYSGWHKRAELPINTTLKAYPNSHFSSQTPRKGVPITSA